VSSQSLDGEPCIDVAVSSSVLIHLSLSLACMRYRSQHRKLCGSSFTARVDVFRPRSGVWMLQHLMTASVFSSFVRHVFVLAVLHVPMATSQSQLGRSISNHLSPQWLGIFACACRPMIWNLHTCACRQDDGVGTKELHRQF
jgi:hypothetical protein